MTTKVEWSQYSRDSFDLKNRRAVHIFGQGFIYQATCDLYFKSEEVSQYK